ncbi:IAP3-like protein [Mya arenaria]|nr:IAP3-like protein [Mya arenaria]
MNSSETVLFGNRLKRNSYAKYEDRLSSYQTWPQQMNQDKYALAKSGFIYSKEGDIVECFACGVKVSQWAVNDIPDLEHKKWSPECAYIKLTCSRDTYDVAAFASVNFDF